MLGDLIRKTSLDSPGDDFTNKVMARIQVNSLTESIAQQPFISAKLWFIIGFALATLVVSVFFIDFSFLGNLFSGVSIEQPRMVDFFTSTFNAMGQWFSGVKLSSVSVMILISIALLVIIERLLRKPRTTGTLVV